MSEYALPVPLAGYPAGTILRDVPLREVRAWECNRCGDCCSGLRPGVAKDGETGLPLFTWGSSYPGDLYEVRYGRRMLRPVVRYEGDIAIGDAFEVDADGKPYACFSCAFLVEHPEGELPETTCELYGRDTDPSDLSTIRPRNCGEFPVFGLDVDATIIDGHPYVPPTGSLPRCTWHGIRVVGPWRHEPEWEQRWRDQQEQNDGVCDD